MQLVSEWQLREQFEFANIPNKYRDWLIKPYILSKAFKRHCQHFTVRLLSQAHTTLLPDEAERLDMGDDEIGFIRQVYLQGDGQPWSYGRITVPRTTLAGRQDLFENVGTKPFGEAILYGDATMQRSDFEYRCLTAGDPLYRQATQSGQIQAEKLYSRRSVFHLKGFPLLVTEIFFPFVPYYVDE